MSSKRATIGRTFPSTPLISGDDTTVTTFTLRSGRQATFRQTVVAPEAIAEKTFVRQEVNGRDQAGLTPESLRDIVRTLPVQQFFPVIGVRVGERVEIIDGSRRRAAALLCHTGLNMLVTDTPICVEDARQLAADIQTSRAHNLRETGLRLKLLMASGLSQKEIAESEGLSQAKVTRALQAAGVAAELIALFPVQDELSLADYQWLLKFQHGMATRNIPLQEAVRQVQHQLTASAKEHCHLPSDEGRRYILRVLKSIAGALVSPPVTTETITPLWAFSDKDRYARKRQKGRVFSYEFNRLPGDLQRELDTEIERVLQKYLAQEG